MSASNERQGREEHVGIWAVLTADTRAWRLALSAVLAFGLAAALLSPALAEALTPTPSPKEAVPKVTSPGSASPQAPSATSQPAPSPGVTPPSTGSEGTGTAEPTPEHIEKARQLILATGISRSFQIIIPEFMAQIGTSLTQSRPELIDDMNKVLDQLRPEFDKQSDEMIDQSARIYAKLLSEKDIDAVLGFFNSEAGRRYVGAQPLFLNQLVSGMQAWQQKISTTMMARVREEMKKKGHDL